jgi:hypothetical protein
MMNIGQVSGNFFHYHGAWAPGYLKVASRCKQFKPIKIMTAKKFWELCADNHASACCIIL